MNKNNKKLIGIITLVAAIIVITVVTVAVIVNSNSPERRIREQLDLGNKYLSELNYEQAIASFETILEIDPQNEEAINGLGDTFVG